MLKIFLWTHTSLPQSEGVQLLIQSNHWCPALVAYLSVLIAFLMSFKWGNIKPCHVNLPQVGCWMGMSQKALLWCWNWWTTNTLLKPVPTGLICSSRSGAWWAYSSLCPVNTEEDALCRSSQEWTCLGSRRAGELPEMWQHAAAEVSLSGPMAWLPPRHSLAIPVGLLLSILE